MDARIKKSIEILKYIIEDLILDNPKQLSKSLGFERPERIYKILRGEGSISRNLASIINSKYPKYSIDWLLTGEGDMLLPNDNVATQVENKGNVGTQIENEHIIDYKDKYIKLQEDFIEAQKTIIALKDKKVSREAKKNA